VGRCSKCVGQAGCSVGGWEEAASVWAKHVVQWVGGKKQQACGPSGLLSGWVGRHSKCEGQAGCSVGGWEDAASVWVKQVVRGGM